MDWYLRVLKNYAVFDGRARRKEYWFFVLFNIIFGVMLAAVDDMTGTFNPATGLGMLSGVYSLAVLIPGIAVSIRRLHDTDRSGWWLLLLFVPVVGGLVLLFFTVQRGTQGSNRFGPDPVREEAFRRF